MSLLLKDPLAGGRAGPVAVFARVQSRPQHRPGCIDRVTGTWEARALAGEHSEAGPGVAGLDQQEREPAPPAGLPTEEQPGRPRERPSAGPRPPAGRPPSWGTVLATTVRLWWQRRVRARAGRPRWRLTALIVVVVVLAAVAAVAVALTGGGTGSGRATASPSASQRASSGPALSPAEAQAAATARTAAATWVAQQVTPGTVVGCDAQMCSDLEQAGLPVSQLLYLGVGTAGPLESSVLVATATVRQEYGSRLDSVYAPDVLASFGTGTAQVAVRVVAPRGAAAYAASLRADLAARLSAGRQLLHNPRLHPSAAARQALTAGEADSRLLADFAALAAGHPLRVIDFGAAPAGLSPGQPLRTADIAPAGFGTAAKPDNLRLLARLLLAGPARYRPASLTRLRLPGGTAVLRVTFTAPSPLGLGARG
jgi:hypothetical protein